MVEDTSNAATPIAAKMAFGFVLISNLTALRLLLQCVDANDESAIFGGGDARN